MTMSYFHPIEAQVGIFGIIVEMQGKTEIK